MPTIGIVDVLVKPSFKGMQQSVGRELDGVANTEGARAGKNMGAKLGGAFKVGALAVAGGAIGALGLALTKGFGRLQAIENAKASLSGLGHSAESVKGIMDNALESVKGTAFGLGEAATVAANAVASGVKPGKDLERTLKLTGDAATIAGVGMEEMGAIFGKVASSNKIQGDVIAQLNDNGIPIVQLMAKELGKTSEETVKLASAGKINFATFQNAMEKGLGGAALKSGQTLQGAFDNTMAAIGRIGANLLSGVYPKIRDFFTGAINWLKPFEASAKTIGENVGNFLNTAITKGGEFAAFFKSDVLPRLQDFGKLVSESFGPSIERIGVFIRDTLVPAMQKFAGYIATEVLPNLQNLGSFILTDVIPALGNFSTWLLDNKDTIANVATGITVLLLPALVRMGITALTSAGQQVLAWAMASGGAVKAGIVYLAQSYLIIGRWVAMGLAAIASGAETVAIWALYKIEAIKGAIAYGVQSAYVAAAWVAMSTAAVLSGAKTAAVWVGSVVASAASGAFQFMLNAGRVVGGWVLMGFQSLLQAGRMAAAWLIAMGPVGWVIAAVVGLAAIVIANWDKIASFTRDLWEKHVKPVFDALGNFITKDVPAAFEKGVGFIGTAWGKLQDLAKAPVKFVVDTVINDGLINGLNNIGGLLGLPQIPRIPPLGFMTGGYTGNGGKDEPAGVVHGGEFVFTKEQTKRAGVANLYAMAKSLAGFRDGGFVNPLKSLSITQGYNRVHKGVDFAAGVGTPVFATESGRVSWSGPGVQAPGVWGGNEIHIDGRSGIQEWFAHLSSMAVRVGDMVRQGQQIGLSGNTGITSGPHLHFGTFAGGWPNDINPLGYLSGAGEPSGGGFNPLAGILDGLLSKFRGAFPMGGIVADMAIGVGKKLFGSITDLITGGGQGAAVGPALYDLGGILPPGVSQVVNRTGKPEAILNPQQWADISRLATQGGAGGGDTYHVQLPQEATVSDLMDAVTFKQRVNKRAGARR